MNLTKFLPFENYVLTTKLSLDEVYNRLAANVEPKKSFRLSIFTGNPTKAYEGEISKYAFRISRIITYKNSFLPIISGEILTLPGQTQINIKMKLSPFVLIFAGFWLSIVGLLSIYIIAGTFTKASQYSSNGFTQQSLIPLGMFIFFCLLTLISFKVESGKSRKFLKTILDGEEKSNQIL
jgi:hypothetical protein